jgi:hypothetical protein
LSSSSRFFGQPRNTTPPPTRPPPLPTPAPDGMAVLVCRTSLTTLTGVLTVTPPLRRVAGTDDAADDAAVRVGRRPHGADAAANQNGRLLHLRLLLRQHDHDDGAGRGLRAHRGRRGEEERKRRHRGASERHCACFSVFSSCVFRARAFFLARRRESQRTKGGGAALFFFLCFLC